MKVPLHPDHAVAGARFIPFAGYDMPLQFSSILKEHAAVRTAAGLFDVSHMSNLWIDGPDAEGLLSRTLAADVAKLKPGRAVYTVACRPDGTILDDLIVYRFGPQRFHVIVNAGNNDAFAQWFARHAEGEVEVQDLTQQWCILALQGPRAPAILARAYPEWGSVKRFAVHEVDLAEGHAFMAGTGYTGEAGVELVVPNAAAAACWRRLLSTGRDDGLVPCGLGARDTLRLEKGFCLAPHEFKGGRSPLEAGLGWTVAWDHDFVGKQALEAQRDAGDHDRLVGLRATGRGVPREDCRVLAGGRAVGVVTSGTMSPTLRQGIALAYVPPDHAGPGTALGIEVRGHRLEAVVTPPPFV